VHAKEGHSAFRAARQRIATEISLGRRTCTVRRQRRCQTVSEIPSTTYRWDVW